MVNRKGMMRESLYESLRELMLKKPIEKITIKQICDETGVIRATFYNYFDDKYDCLNAIVMHDLAEEGLDNLNRDSSRDTIEKALSNVDSYRDFYRIAYNVTGQNSFEEMIRSNLQQMFERYFRQYRRQGSLEQYSDAVLSGYYAQSMSYVIKVFVFQREGSLSVKQAAQMMLDLMGHKFYDFVTYSS
ncbi:MAG: TetR family transcriptional regulator [Erysipelotrichia bacterium]|nr:TetR family transcriptional regulator [Erysipelotrichia bacterium]